jgi:putative transposase
MAKKKTALIPQKERMALLDRQDAKIPLSDQCKWLGLNRSSVYYRPKKLPEIQLTAMRNLDQLYLEDPTRGTRRMGDELTKKGIPIGRFATRTLMRRMRLKTIYCRPRTTCIAPADYKYPYLLRNMKICYSNQVWAADITYIPLARGYMYLFAIMDLKSRFILNWSLSNTMEASWVVRVLKGAIEKYGRPEIINTDQGSQFTSEEWVGYIKGLRKTKISMDGKGRAIDNVFIERFWRTLKYEKIHLQPIENGQKANGLIHEFVEYYNHKRAHSSIEKQTPLEAYQQANRFSRMKVIAGIFHGALWEGAEKSQNNFPSNEILT